MRKLIVFIFFLLGYPLYSQTIEENKIYQIYNVPNLSSKDLFTKIHFALSLLYQDSEDVIKYLNLTTIEKKNYSKLEKISGEVNLTFLFL